MSKKIRNRPDELKSAPAVDAAADEAPAPRKVATVAARPPAATTGFDWKDHLLPLFLGFVCAYLPYKVEPHIRDLFQLPKQMILAEAAAWLVLIAGGLALLGRPLKLPRTPMIWPGLVLMVAIAGGVWVAPQQTGGELSIFARTDAHRWVSAALIFTLALLSLTTPNKLWYLIGGNALGGLLVSLIGIGEQHHIPEFLPAQHWNLITMPGSTFGNRNMAAQEIVAVMPVAYVMITLSLRWFLTGRVWQALVLGSASALGLVTMLYFLLLTVTRSAWLGAGFGVLVALLALVLGLWWSRRRAAPAEAGSDPPGPQGLGALFGAPSKRVLRAVAILAASLLVVLAVADKLKPADANAADANDEKKKASIVELFRSFLDSKANHYRWRIGMAESTVEAIKDKPFGGGAGNWRVIYPQYVTQREKNEMFNIAKQPIRAHNDFLQFGSEFGVHGLLALLTLLAMAGFLTVRVVSKAASPLGKQQEDAAWLAFCALASLASLIAICGDAMASFPLQLPGPTFLFSLHLATIGSAEAMLYERGFFGQSSEGRSPNPQWLGITVALVGVAALKFLGPIYLAPGQVYLDTFRNWSVEQAKDKGLHDRWMVAELGFTDGRALQKVGKPQAGLLAIQRAIALNPDDFQNHFIEGLNLNSLGRTKDAIASIENSLKLYPNLLNAWVNLAMFNRRLGDEKKMNSAIDTALRLKPDELIALNVRAAWLEERGNYEEELKILRPQIKPYAQYRDSPNWPNDDNGQLLGAWKQALGHIVVAARKTDHLAELYEYLRLLYNEPVSNEIGRSAQSKDKEKMERAAELADVLGKLGRWQEALPHFKEAAELARDQFPEQKWKYAAAALRLGDVTTGEHEARVARDLNMARADLAKALDELADGLPERAAAIGAVREKLLGKRPPPPPAAPSETAPAETEGK